MMHWATIYIGLPHERMARGPRSFDCWGLLRFIYSKHYSIELPNVPGFTEAAALLVTGGKFLHGSNWERIEQPFEGCAVAMTQFQKRVFHHVGIYIECDNTGRVLHCWDGCSVAADTIKSLKLKGFQHFAFYRHKSWPT